MSMNPLGSLSIPAFLQQYWQKKAHLFRQSYPDFLGFLTASEIKRLAQHPDVQSRLVMRHGSRYELHHGPFRPIDMKHLGSKNWTLLVQSLNHWNPEADALLQQFRFIPYARLDDVMVSYAMPGGGVGPHFDHYDVFLLQGYGIRRWEIAKTQDLRIRPNQALKLLKHFKAQESWDLDPGDMLYLPPKWAHHGTAITECFTYSIGFRAPTHQEWINAMLDYLRDELCVEGVYQDPNLTLQTHPAELSKDLIEQVSSILNKIRWQKKEVVNMVGRYLSEPKPHVFFDAQRAPLSLSEFSRLWEKQPLVLDPRSQLLFHQHCFFMNGEALQANQSEQKLLTQLADHKLLPSLPKKQQPKSLVTLFYNWFEQGWLHLG